VIPSRKLRPQKEGETDEDYNKYVKKSLKNAEDYQIRKTQKSFNKPKVLPKDISEKELELKIPGLSEKDIKKSIDITKQLREQQKSITQQEEDVFKLFSF
jgi:hypothetical protein